MNLSRSGGCTLTGALSVTTQVRDAVTIVHGPKGCTHHNFSLLHATGLDNDRILFPDMISTALSESDIIFGGEEALKRTLDAVAQEHPGAVFVLSTCIVETIGDDISAVCHGTYEMPVIQIPTAGFLGGTFQNGVNNALNAIAGFTKPCAKGTSVNIIGEKNLEYEVEENYAEIGRLLGALEIPVNVRFIRNCTLDDISCLGAAGLNILRDSEVRTVGERLKQQSGTPFVPSFPVGFEGTIRFIESVAGRFGIDCRQAVNAEQALQKEILTEFNDLTGTSICFDPAVTVSDVFPAAREIAEAIPVSVTPDGCRVPLPLSPPVGTGGIRHMLHRWRRAMNA